jgi:hypothetical protein
MFMQSSFAIDLELQAPQAVFQVLRGFIDKFADFSISDALKLLRIVLGEFEQNMRIWE